MAPSLVTWPMRKTGIFVLFSPLHQLKGSFPNLGNGTGGGGQAGAIQGLDGVQGQVMRLGLFHQLENIFQAGFGGYQQGGRGNAQAVGPELELGCRFLPGDIQAGITVSTETVQDLQHQSGFTDARIAAQEDHRAEDQTASQGPIKLRAAAGTPFLLHRRQAD